MTYVFHPAAEAEFLESVGYYESEAAGLGGAFKEGFEAVAELIGDAPKSCQFILPGCQAGLSWVNIGQIRTLSNPPVSVMLKLKSKSDSVKRVHDHEPRTSHSRGKRAFSQ